MNNDYKLEPAGIRGEGLTAGEGAEFLLRHKYRLLLPSVILAAIAVGVAFMLPKQWEAQGILQVGQVFYATSTDQQQVTQIESPARAVERMKLEQFQDAVLRRLKLPAEVGVNRETDLLRGTANARVIRTAELVGISVRGTTPERAKQAVEAYEAELISQHAKLSQPSFQRIADERANVVRELKQAEAQRDSLAQLADNRAKQDAKGQFSEAVLLNQMIQKNETELRDLKRRAAYLEEQASTERTFNTRPLGEIDVGRRAVWPRKANFLIVGAAIGLAAGFVWSLLVERRLRRRTEALPRY